GITPSVVDPQETYRQPCPRTLHTIGAIEYLHRPPRSTRRCTVALVFSDRSPAPAQGTRQYERSHGKKAARRRTRTRKNLEPTTIMRYLVAGNAPASAPDWHLSPGSCIHWATSDMLQPQNSPFRSVAT